MTFPLSKIKGARRRYGLETPVLESEDPYIAGIPQDLTIQDCLVDPAKHATLEEQRTFYSAEMHKMATLDEG